MTDVNSIQIGGKHYKTKFQHWDFNRKVQGGRYLEGCATKYVSRWRKKNGLQDLQKSAHYLEKMISVISAGDYLPPLYLSRDFDPKYLIDMFCDANELLPDECSIMRLVSDWRDVHDLEVALTTVKTMIAREQTIADEILRMRQENP